MAGFNREVPGGPGASSLCSIWRPSIKFSALTVSSDPLFSCQTGNFGPRNRPETHRRAYAIRTVATIFLSMLRFETAGESHGECLVATLTGLPAGVPVSVAAINRELWRRQQGYGRGGRMKIETDQAHIVSGVRHSKTIGSPIAILLENKDWKNWTEALPVEDIDGGEDRKKPVTRPRPGHADLAGVIKYNFQDARYILERASARETTARVAVGAFAKAYLAEFGISV